MNDLVTPNYTEMFARTFQAGREMARSKGVQNALSMTDPALQQTELVKYGALDEANALARHAADQHATALRQQVGTQAAGGDFAGAQGTALQGGDPELAAQIAKMDETHRAASLHITEVMAQGLFGLRNLPPETRHAKLQGLAPFLVAQGVPQDLIDKSLQGDLSDESIDAAAHSVLSVKDQIAASMKEDSSERDDKRFDELVRYHDAMIGLGQGRLGLSQQREHRVSTGGGRKGGGASASGLPAGFVVDH